MPIIEDVKKVREKITDSSNSDWKKPSQMRKFVMVMQLNILEKQMTKNNLVGAYDKLPNDIKPKLTTFWVINDDLQTEFSIFCD